MQLKDSRDEPPVSVDYRVRDRVLHAIDRRLFGQFMERPSWGEIGAEAAVVPGTRELQPDVRRLIEQMQIPIVRFPGGTDVDYLDWRDMISNVPGRGGDRPVSVGHKGHPITNNFGYDEFLRLRAELGTEAILVVNFGQALLGKKPLAEQAGLAAGLVAYCNAPQGAALPPGMPDWPAVRRQNGHAAPYGVRYWQIGNETWFFDKELRQLAGEGADDRYADCATAFARAMLEVDPTIEFLFDAHGPTQRAFEIIRGRLGGKAAYAVFHIYTPSGMAAVLRDGREVPAADLTAEDIWNAWTATPAVDGDGLAVFTNPLLAEARKAGFPVAVTEWNWNGGWGRNPQAAQMPLNSALAKGVGAAGFLHALMRAGNVAAIGCQSLLVGCGWPIHAIRADRQAVQPPYFMPSGQATMMYSQHHGENLLAMDSSGVPTYRQGLEMGRIKPADKVAYLDALATAGDRAVFFHAINRHFRAPMSVTVDLREVGPLAEAATHWVLSGRLHDKPAEGEPVQVAEIASRPAAVRADVLSVVLPPRSISCIELPPR